MCPDRTDHVFWDLVHPTETTARKHTAVAFAGDAPLVSPVNVRLLCTVYIVTRAKLLCRNLVGLVRKTDRFIGPAQLLG